MILKTRKSALSLDRRMMSARESSKGGFASVGGQLNLKSDGINGVLSITGLDKE